AHGKGKRTSVGATLGATRTDDLGSWWTAPDEAQVISRACGRIRTGVVIVWGPTDQKVRGSNPFGCARSEAPSGLGRGLLHAVREPRGSQAPNRAPLMASVAGVSLNMVCQ